jgi:regulator of extracellular matrix RemA (YlzA/DUF370 family)
LKKETDEKKENKACDEGKNEGRKERRNIIAKTSHMILYALKPILFTFNHQNSFP